VDGGGKLRAFRKRVAKEDEEGCAYILDGGGQCDGLRRPGSPYCEQHHALCHVAGGSPREQRRLREAEALASAVGGRRGLPARIPPDRVLRRLENVARGFARRDRSRFVFGDDR